MKANNKTAQMFGYCSPTLASRSGLKKISEQITKIPVLIIGTKRLAMIMPRTGFFFLKSLKTKPATNPAIVHLSKHARNVPTGLIGIKMANVDGERSAIMPLKKPTTAPERGPQITAAITIVIKDKLMLTGPNCK